MTTDTLEFPPIAESPATSVVPAPAGDLAKIDLTAVALSQYGDWRKDVAATKANLSTLVLDLSTAAKCKEARSLRQRLVMDPLAAARKLASGIKSKMAQTSKAVGAELEAIEAAYTEADALILPKIEEREQELEAEGQAKAAAEAARKAKHEGAIATLLGYLPQVRGWSSERVLKALSHVEALTITPEAWEEFAPRAIEARESVLAGMKAELAAAQERERIEAQRLENERIAAELAAQRAAIQREAEELAARQAAQAAATAQNTHQQGDNRDASAEQSHVAEGSASPAGRGENVPTARGASPVLYSEAQAPQQVLKAEPATADATDRGEPATASPSGGSMGEGQAADAAPAGGFVVMVPAESTMHAELSACAAVDAGVALIRGEVGQIDAGIKIVPPTEAEQALTGAAELVAYVLTAFEGKFPTHPKPDQSWWAGLRYRAEALRPMLPEVE